MAGRIAIAELGSAAEFEAWVAGIDDRVAALAERTGIDLDFSSESMDAVGEWALATFASSGPLKSEPGQVSLN